MQGPAGRTPRRTRGVLFATVLAAGVGAGLTAAPAPAAAQSLLERTPNLPGVTLPPRGSTSFTFTHRFDLVGEEARKVVNYPSFTLGAGLPANLALGITYASNSELGAGTPNEWELWARRRFDLAPRAALAVTAGWNSAAKSADGELAARIILHRFLLLVSMRGFSDAFGVGDGAVAVTGGAAWRITPRFSLAADAARIVTTDTLRTAWSLGVHLAIPGTPHTLGLAVSNVGAPTLQGASRGVEETEGGQNLRYGFAFTAPLGTLGQWAQVFGGAEEPGIDVVTVRDFTFGPVEIHLKAGEAVYWLNEDPTTHTVTSDDGMYESGPIDPGEGYSRRFERPGRYTYHCTPHPFMKAIVVVDPG